jgi:NADH:ubiquinone oxidoreductase subunit H
VSGFNTEYSARKFALIFMTEYAMIYLFSFFTHRIFYIRFLFMIIVWIWIRATLPRHRYDLLIQINWKVLLPLRIIAPPLVIISTFYNKIPLFNCRLLIGHNRPNLNYTNHDKNFAFDSMSNFLQS